MDIATRIANLEDAISTIVEVDFSLDPGSFRCPCCNGQRHQRMAHHLQREALRAACNRLRGAVMAMREMGSLFDVPGGWEEFRAQLAKREAGER